MSIYKTLYDPEDNHDSEMSGKEAWICMAWMALTILDLLWLVGAV